METFAVFLNGFPTDGDLEASAQLVGERVVAKGARLFFAVDQFANPTFDARRGDVAGDRFRKEGFQRDEPARRREPFVDASAGNGRQVESDFVGDLPERQRASGRRRVVEIIALEVDGGLRDAEDGRIATLERVEKSGRVDVLAAQIFFRRLVDVLREEHFAINRVDAELRAVVVESSAPTSGRRFFEKNFRANQARRLGREEGTRRRMEREPGVVNRRDGREREPGFFGDRRNAFLLEVVERFGDNSTERVGVRNVVANAQQEAFLQRARADARRVERLNDGERFFGGVAFLFRRFFRKQRVERVGRRGVCGSVFGGRRDAGSERRLKLSAFVGGRFASDGGVETAAGGVASAFGRGVFEFGERGAGGVERFRGRVDVEN